MKKLFFALLVAGSLAACNSNEASENLEDKKDSTVDVIENTTDSLQSNVQENADSTKARLERESDSLKNHVEATYDAKDSMLKK
ncbi:MAG: hypothetical protein ABIR19_04545 [Ginsengibacter sp.]